MIGKDLARLKLSSVVPTITVAQVHAALAYYYDHRSEIDAEMADENKHFEELKAKQPSIVDKLRHRKTNAPDDPIPPG